jgi:hypothetical protein
MALAKVSFFASAIRTWLWPRLYASLEGNSIPFEMIFVGDREPEWKLPGNVRFIYSPVKPAQCFEIAVRQTQADLIIPFGDDMLFSYKAVDLLYERFMTQDNDLLVLSPRYSCNGDLYDRSRVSFFSGNTRSPLLPICGLMKKQLWEKVGGVDRNFVALCWDMDVCMRVYEIGGTVERYDEVMVSEISTIGGRDESFLYREVGLPFDRALLESLWVDETITSEDDQMRVYCLHPKKGALMRKRMRPVEGFDEHDLLTVTQGTKGRWQ